MPASAGDCFLIACVVLATASCGQTSGAARFESAPAPAVEEGFFNGANDVRLFYRKAGRGSDVIVFLHGGPGSNFRGSGDYLEPLAARRTVIMYDQRGSGRSQLVTDPALLTAEHHVRDLERLRVHFGIERMTLAGLSWGSGLAALYTAQHPERVERLLLISPMPPTRDLLLQRTQALNALLGAAGVQRRSELRERLPHAGDAEAVALCRESSDLTFRLYLVNASPENLRHAAQRCDIPPAAIRNRAVVEAATVASLGNWDFGPMLARLRMPALVMEAARSNVPLYATREWAAALPGARLVLIPEAGHEFFVDRPAAFLQAAEAFLGGRLPPTVHDRRNP